MSWKAWTSQPATVTLVVFALLLMSAFATGAQESRCPQGKCDLVDDREISSGQAWLQDVERRLDELRQEAAAHSASIAARRKQIDDALHKRIGEPSSPTESKTLRDLREAEQRLNAEDVIGQKRLMDAYARLEADINSRAETFAQARREKEARDAAAAELRRAAEVTASSAAADTRSQDETKSANAATEAGRAVGAPAAPAGQSETAGPATRELIELRALRADEIYEPNAAQVRLPNGFTILRRSISRARFENRRKELGAASGMSYRKISNTWYAASWNTGDFSFYELGLRNGGAAGTVTIASPLNGRLALDRNEVHAVARIACSAYLGAVSLPCARR
ncbi:MAG: hypothetical protein AB7O57_09620 [Hyphomicrobiaceae bacterium]